MARAGEVTAAQDLLLFSIQEKLSPSATDGRQERLRLVDVAGLPVSSTRTALPVPRAYLALLLGSLQNAFLNGALTDEPVHSHLLRLPQAVRPVHGLLVHCGVPVAVIENHLRRQDRNTARTEHSQGKTRNSDSNSATHLFARVSCQIFFYDIKMSRYSLIKLSHCFTCPG